MARGLDDLHPSDGDVVTPEEIPRALTAGEFVFDDGATQVFAADGTTSYVERGGPTAGTWYVEGEQFCSFWPPSYTGCYEIRWLVEDGAIAGLQFVEAGRGSVFNGRYQA